MYGYQGEKEGWDELGDWDSIHTIDTMYEIYN